MKLALPRRATFPGGALFREWLFALAAACGVAWGAGSYGLLDRIDFKLQDWAIAQVADEPDPRILVVAIDDAALSAVGPWPWSRARQAELIEAIGRGQPAALAIDVLYLEATDPEDDAALAGALGGTGRAVLPHTFGPRTNSLNQRDPLWPVEPLRSAARATGHAELNFDPDGTVRSVPLASVDGALRYPHLMVATARVAGEDRRAAADDPRPALIPFHRLGAMPTISAEAVIRGKLPETFLRDRIVLIGVTAQGVGDRYVVPGWAGSSESGVIVNAQVLDALLRDNFVRPVPAWGVQLFAMVSVVALFLGFWMLHPRHTLRFALALVGGVVALALALPVLAHLWLPPMAAVLAILVAYPLWAWRRLVSLLGYLQRETADLHRLNFVQTPAAPTGFDRIERQLDRFSGLVHAVRERYDLLRTAIQSAPEPIILFDSDDRVVASNARAHSLFGSAILGLTFADLLMLARAGLSDDGEELELPDGRVFKQARGRFEGEEDIRLSEILQLHEITAIRQAERERREMLEFLSHDMRSPQSSILLLAREPRLPYDDDQRLKLIAGEAERTLAIADTFVQYARLRSIEFDLVSIDLAAIATSAVAHLLPAAQHKGIALERQMPDRPLMVAGDTALVLRMIENLIGNAIKYCPQGATVRVATRTDPEAPGCGVLVIEDDGPGLPEERRADPFARFGPESGTRPGAGLGLAFVADVVGRLSGTIVVDSEPGKGARFTIAVPLA